ncbi:MAG: HEAT repeat protein [Planctomycetota bacterium]
MKAAIGLSRGGGKLIGSKMRKTSGAHEAQRRNPVSPFVAVIAVLTVILSTELSAQVVHYPGEAPTQPNRSVLDRIGGGAAKSPKKAPGARIEVADSSATKSNAAITSPKPRFLEWERWWHGQLYGVLAERRFAEKKAENVAYDLLVNKDVLRLLRKRFAEGSVEERAAAAVALARLGNKSISNDLIFALENAPGAVQEAIVLAFGINGTEDARSLLSSLALDGRFGRRALGRPRQPIPTKLRCVALLASGMLPAKKSDDTLHKILMSPEKQSVELHRAACLALGLHAAASADERQQAQRYGRSVRPWNLCVEHRSKYFAKLEQDDLSDSCKSLLLLSMARALPSEDSLVAMIISLLDSDNAVLSRSAAAAAGDLSPADSKALNAALWGRLAKGGDAATAGLILLSIGRRADDDNFRKLLTYESVVSTLRPYLAFALLEGSKNHELRRGMSVKRVRGLTSASIRDDGVGLAGVSVALGLLRDTSSTEMLASINAVHPMITARSAAGLALGLLGQGNKCASDWRLETRRASGFLVHDGALAMALSENETTAADLCAVLKERRDSYSLGGIAQAFGLLKCAKSVKLLTNLINDETTPTEVKSFAIGALGLVLEKNPGAWSRRIRSLAPIPVSTPVLADILAHL